MSSKPVVVSVIVATNRSSPFLAEALESVVRQSYPAVELIVVDDGSPDASAIDAAVRRASTGSVVHCAPAGVSAARNAGVAAAAGSYIAFLDDDDRWAPDRISSSVELFEGRSDAVAVYCGMRVVNAAGDVLIESQQTGGADRLAIARGDVAILPGNLMVTRTSFEAVGGFDPALSAAEDLDLVLKLSARGPLLFVDRELVDYRAHDGNMTRNTHDLVIGIRQVRRRHRRTARLRRDTDLVRALNAGLLRNQRFAWWRTGRSVKQLLRERRPVAALRELGWVVVVAPLGPISAVVERVSRSRR
jgi:glycosyltransferase involved in cell wall biosynthesis